MNRYKITIMLTKLNIEIWRELVLGDTVLLVSNFGNIQTTDKEYVDKNGRKRIKKGKAKDTFTNTCTKYEYINITINGISKKLTIHRLMAMAFIPNYANLPMVNHIDEDRQNNNLDNLEWCTNKQNSNYGTRNKRLSENHIGLQTGSNNGRSRKIICVELDMAYAGMVAEEFETKIQMNLNFEDGILRFVWSKDGKVVNLELNISEIRQSRDLEEYRDLMIRKVWSGMEC